MKLIINDKVFVAKYNDKQELIISLDNDIDVKFFKKWSEESEIKKDRTKDIPFIKITETGILKNCVPILNLNEDEVEIVYDYYLNISKTID